MCQYVLNGTQRANSVQISHSTTSRTLVAVCQAMLLTVRSFLLRLFMIIHIHPHDSLSPLANHSNKRSCEVSGLMAYTLYDCKIHPKFNNNDVIVRGAKEITIRTSPGGELL